MRWIIGDIHGMLKPLDALLTAVRSADGDPHFIFSGDYVNRGPESRGVVDRLLTLGAATFLRGNHDDVFDLILNGENYIGPQENFDAVAAFGWFMNHGLADTLLAYGANRDELQYTLHFPSPQRLEQAVSIVPAAHRHFFRTLLPVAEFEDCFVLHAFWQPEETDEAPPIAERLPDNARLRNQILWGRYSDSQIHGAKRWKRTGYFGHTPVSNYRKSGDLIPVIGDQCVLLDTASALGPFGRLSAVSPDSGQIIQADRAGVIIPLAENALDATRRPTSTHVKRG
jgi:hypothetical protein